MGDTRRDRGSEAIHAAEQLQHAHARRVAGAAVLALAAIATAGVWVPSWGGRQTLEVPCAEHRRLLDSPAVTDERQVILSVTGDGSSLSNW